MHNFQYGFALDGKNVERPQTEIYFFANVINSVKISR